MKEKTLLKTALITSLIGLFFLYLFSENITINESNIEKITLDNKDVKIGGALSFELTLESNEPTSQLLLIDYVVHFMKSNGKTAEKVFKWTKRTISKNETLKINRKQPIKQHSTRKVYPGQHFIEIQINGKRFGKAAFNVS